MTYAPAGLGGLQDRASSRRSDDLVEENILGPPEIQAPLRALDGSLKPLALAREEQ